MKVLSLNGIYFHASEFETVGLPLYEAQELGLKIVVPNKSYSKYFLSDHTYLYKYKNTEDALSKIHDAGIAAEDYIFANSYSENWGKILDKI